MPRNQSQYGFEIDDSNPHMSSTVHQRSEAKHQMPIASAFPDIGEPVHDTGPFLYGALGKNAIFAVDQPVENLYNVASNPQSEPPTSDLSQNLPPISLLFNNINEARAACPINLTRMPSAEDSTIPRLMTTVNRLFSA